MTIHEALSIAQAKVKAAFKSGDNKFDKYHYAKLEDFIEVVKPIMADLGLALTISADDLTPLEDRKTKNGGDEHAVRVRLTGTLWFKDGTFITAQCFGEGQDRADKAIYKAITGGKKYLMAGMFQIPTTDDPEADETVGVSHAPVARQPNQLAVAFKAAIANGHEKAKLLQTASQICGHEILGAADIHSDEVPKVIAAWGAQ